MKILAGEIDRRVPEISDLAKVVLNFANDIDIALYIMHRITLCIIVSCIAHNSIVRSQMLRSELRGSVIYKFNPISLIQSTLSISVTV